MYLHNIELQRSTSKYPSDYQDKGSEIFCIADDFCKFLCYDREIYSFILLSGKTFFSQFVSDKSPLILQFLTLNPQTTSLSNKNKRFYNAYDL